MENFFANLLNGWTFIDLVIMFTLLYWMLYFKKQRDRKEEYLKIADIGIKDLKSDLQVEKNRVHALQERIEEKQKLIDRCTVRPTLPNGQFVKKDYKPTVAYIAKENIYNKDGVKVFTEAMQYPKLKTRVVSCYGDDGVKYVIDTRKFTPVYQAK